MALRAGFPPPGSTIICLAALQSVAGWNVPVQRASRSICSRLNAEELPRASSLVSDPCWRAEGLAAIDEHNEDLCATLDELRAQSYFRFYSVDLLKGCNYFPQSEDECVSTCELYPSEEEDIPSAIKKVDASEHEFELDAWVRWDMPSDDYYGELDAMPLLLVLPQ